MHIVTVYNSKNVTDDKAVTLHISGKLKNYRLVKNTESFRPKDRPHGGRRRSRPCGRVPQAIPGCGENGRVRKE